MPRPISALLSLQNLDHNLQCLSQILGVSSGGSSELMVVIKANAYGHGIERVYPALRQAQSAALLDLAEARTLRQLGWTRPVLLLEGAFQACDYNQIANLNLDFTVHCGEQLQNLQTFLDQSNRLNASRVFVKINTGMNRLGFSHDQAVDAMLKVLCWQSEKRLAGVVLMTHFANADTHHGIGPKPTEQFRRFMAVSNQVKTKAQAMGLLADFKTCLSNSSAVFLNEAPLGDIHRVGIATYGALSGPVAAEKAGLLPVMQLSAGLIAIQNLQVGDCVGYGSRFQVQSPMRIGVVACGYADGYPRQAPDGTPVLVSNPGGGWIRTRLVGRVSMDMLTIDLTPIPDAQIGSKVLLFGHSNLSADEVATCCGTIAYELFSAVASRVPFIVKNK